MNFRAPHIQVLQSESPTMYPECRLKSEIKGESSHTDTRCYTGAGVGEKGGRGWREHLWNAILQRLGFTGV